MANWGNQADLPAVDAVMRIMHRLDILNRLMPGLYTNLLGTTNSRVNRVVHSNLKITEILDIFSTSKIILKPGFIWLYTYNLTYSSHMTSVNFKYIGSKYLYQNMTKTQLDAQ